MLEWAASLFVGVAAIAGMTLLWGVVFPVLVMGAIIYAFKLVPLTGQWWPRLARRIQRPR